jgi:hypothetical protein
MAGILKVDTIQNANADNIITQTNSTTLTIGTSGDTVTLAAGATSSGFGRTGTVNWDTTKKTSGFTAVSGVGYFCDTTSSAFTMTLPATPSAGDIVALKDYANTFDTNNLTIGRNGSNINGIAANAIISVQGQALTLIYIDATQGWSAIYGATDADLPIPQFVAATGGTVLTCGDFKTHVFTGPGTFCVSSAGNPAGSTTVEYLTVAGGGSGGRYTSAGGGAGGYRQNYPSPTIAGLPVSVQGYPITVGAGGASVGTAGLVPNSPPVVPSQLNGNRGSSSIFSTITSTGGGGGGGCFGSPAGPTFPSVGPGGSGGGGGRNNPPVGGTGNTPPVSPSQGNNGGGSAGACSAGGGGGGAGGVGTNGTSGSPGPGSARGGGAGGIGATIATAFFGPTAPSYGTPGPAPGRYFAGGGAGGTFDANPGSTISGGAGGGGPAFGANPAGPALAGTAGTINTGGGGGSCGTASGATNAPGAGGSGIVVIRYKFQ